MRPSREDRCRWREDEHRFLRGVIADHGEEIQRRLAEGVSLEEIGEALDVSHHILAAALEQQRANDAREQSCNE